MTQPQKLSIFFNKYVPKEYGHISERHFFSQHHDKCWYHEKDSENEFKATSIFFKNVGENKMTLVYMSCKDLSFYRLWTQFS